MLHVLLLLLCRQKDLLSQAFPQPVATSRNCSWPVIDQLGESRSDQTLTLLPHLVCHYNFNSAFAGNHFADPLCQSARDWAKARFDFMCFRNWDYKRWSLCWYSAPWRLAVQQNVLLLPKCILGERKRPKESVRGHALRVWGRGDALLELVPGLLTIKDALVCCAVLNPRRQLYLKDHSETDDIVLRILIEAGGSVC